MRGGTRPRKGNGPSRPQLLPPRDLPVPTMRRVVQLLRVVDLDEAAAGVVAPAQRAPRRPAGRRAEPRIRRRFQDRRLVLSGAGKRVSPFPFLGNPPPPGPNPPPPPSSPSTRATRANRLVALARRGHRAVGGRHAAAPTTRAVGRGDRARAREQSARLDERRARATPKSPRGNCGGRVRKLVRPAPAANARPAVSGIGGRQPYFKCMHL